MFSSSMLLRLSGESYFCVFRSRYNIGLGVQSSASLSMARPLKSSLFPSKNALMVDSSRLFPKRLGLLRK